MESNQRIDNFLLFQLNELEDYYQTIERIGNEEPSYCMLRVEKADIEVDAGFDCKFVNSGSLLFPDFRQLLFFIGEKIEGTVLFVPYSFISNSLGAKLFKLVLQLRKLKIVQVEPNPSPQIDNYIQMIFSELDRTDNEYQPIIFENLYAILFLTAHKHHFNYSSDLTRSIQIEDTLSFLDLVEESFKIKKSVAWYAEQLGITENQLNESVKKVLNHAAKYFIKQRTIIEAKEMLVMTDDSLTKISTLLGFNEVSYFIKYFIRNTDYQPRKFREEYSKIHY